MITATAIGRISRAGKIVTPQGGGSAFCACTLVSEKEWGGKTYSQFVDIITYGRTIGDLVKTLTEGTLVCASGECSVSKSKDGKYTNLKIMGQVHVLDAPSAPRQAAPATKPEPSAPSSPTKEDDDDVPF